LKRVVEVSTRYRTSKSWFLRDPPTVSIIGAPLRHGQPKAGVDEGPDYIRKHGLIEKLQQDSWNVEDLGDISIPQERGDSKAKLKAKNSAGVGAFCRALYTSVYDEAQQDKFALTLGGDHAIAIGSLSGILKSNPQTGVIWVDAHADLNSPESSGSGNLHGMVLSFLMNLQNTRDTIGFQWMKSENIPKLHESRLVYVGLRDIDAPEKTMIRDMGIKAFTMQDVDRYGLGQVMEMALEHLNPRTSVPRPIHLSFDIDAIDPTYAPSTGTRVFGGLSYREAYYVAEAIAESGSLKSMDMVEVNPSLGDNPSTDSGITAQMAVGIIASALGNTIL